MPIVEIDLGHVQLQEQGRYQVVFMGQHRTEVTEQLTSAPVFTTRSFRFFAPQIADKIELSIAIVHSEKENLSVVVAEAKVLLQPSEALMLHRWDANVRSLSADGTTHHGIVEFRYKATQSTISSIVHASEPGDYLLNISVGFLNSLIEQPFDVMLHVLNRAQHTIAVHSLNNNGYQMLVPVRPSSSDDHFLITFKDMTDGSALYATTVCPQSRPFSAVYSLPLLRKEAALVVVLNLVPVGNSIERSDELIAVVHSSVMRNALVRPAEDGSGTGTGPGAGGDDLKALVTLTPRRRSTFTHAGLASMLGDGGDVSSALPSTNKSVSFISWQPDPPTSSAPMTLSPSAADLRTFLEDSLLPLRLIDDSFDATQALTLWTYHPRVPPLSGAFVLSASKSEVLEVDTNVNNVNLVTKKKTKSKRKELHSLHLGLLLLPHFLQSPGKPSLLSRPFHIQISLLESFFSPQQTESHALAHSQGQGLSGFAVKYRGYISESSRELFSESALVSCTLEGQIFQPDSVFLQGLLPDATPAKAAPIVMAPLQPESCLSCKAYLSVLTLDPKVSLAATASYNLHVNAHALQEAEAAGGVGHDEPPPTALIPAPAPTPAPAAAPAPVPTEAAAPVRAYTPPVLSPKEASPSPTPATPATHTATTPAASSTATSRSASGASLGPRGMLQKRSLSQLIEEEMVAGHLASLQARSEGRVDDLPDEVGVAVHVPAPGEQEFAQMLLDELRRCQEEDAVCQRSFSSLGLGLLEGEGRGSGSGLLGDTATEDELRGLPSALVPVLRAAGPGSTGLSSSSSSLLFDLAAPSTGVPRSLAELGALVVQELRVKQRAVDRLLEEVSVKHDALQLLGKDVRELREDKAALQRQVADWQAGVTPRAPEPPVPSAQERVPPWTPTSIAVAVERSPRTVNLVPRASMLTAMNSLREALAACQSDLQTSQQELVAARVEVSAGAVLAEELRVAKQAMADQAKVLAGHRREMGKLGQYKETIEMQERVISKLQAMMEGKLRSKFVFSVPSPSVGAAGAEVAVEEYEQHRRLREDLSEAREDLQDAQGRAAELEGQVAELRRALDERTRPPSAPVTARSDPASIPAPSPGPAAAVVAELPEEEEKDPNKVTNLAKARIRIDQLVAENISQGYRVEALERQLGSQGRDGAREIGRLRTRVLELEIQLAVAQAGDGDGGEDEGGEGLGPAWTAPPVNPAPAPAEMPPIELAVAEAPAPLIAQAASSPELAVEVEETSLPVPTGGASEALEARAEPAPQQAPSPIPVQPEEVKVSTPEEEAEELEGEGFPLDYTVPLHDAARAPELSPRSPPQGQQPGQAEPFGYAKVRLVRHRVKGQAALFRYLLARVEVHAFAPLDQTTQVRRSIAAGVMAGAGVSPRLSHRLPGGPDTTRSSYCVKLSATDAAWEYELPVSKPLVDHPTQLLWDSVGVVAQGQRQAFRLSSDAVHKVTFACDLREAPGQVDLSAAPTPALVLAQGQLHVTFQTH